MKDIQKACKRPDMISENYSWELVHTSNALVSSMKLYERREGMR